MTSLTYCRRSIFLSVLLLVGLVLGGCGRSRQDATPTPTKTPVAEQAQTSSRSGAPANTPAPADGQGQQAPAAATAAPRSGTTQVAEPTPQPGQATMAVVNASILNVRSSAGTDSQVVATVQQGQQFAVIGRSQDGAWLQLGDNGKELGWVSSQYVTVQSGVAATNQPASAAAPSAAPTQPQASEPPAQVPAGSGNYLPATMLSPDFGAQAFLWWRPEIADRDLKLMDEADFHWVKQTFAWETMEDAGPGQFDWSIADRVVQQVNKAGLKLLGRLSSDPQKQNWWAGHPPGNADAFADFAYAVANRYNCSAQAVGCIQAFQIWNEPNLAREWGGNRPDPAQYAEFLRKAYSAIKRGNPNAIVISAGMAPTGDNNENAMPDDVFYEGLYQAMGDNSTGYFDMLGVHGAGFAAPPELDPAIAASDKHYGGYRFFSFRHVEDIRAIMVKHGDSAKKIVLLEFGWTFDPVNPSYKWHGADAGITAMVQADYLKRAYQYAAANWRPWVALMSLLTMPNLDWLNNGDPQHEEQYWWAIMEPSQINELKFRPAYVELCIYFNGVEGKTCKYDPNKK